MQDPQILKLKEQAKPRRLTPFGRFLALSLTILALATLYNWATRPDLDPAPAIAEQGQGQGSNGPNVIINNNNTAAPPIPASYPNAIQVIRFTNIVPEAIGHRYQHGNLTIGPVPCGRTNICAFVIPPMQANANYCITYRYYSNDYKCVPVDPSQPYVEINVTD